MFCLTAEEGPWRLAETVCLLSIYTTLFPRPAEVFGPPCALKVDLHRGSDSCVICIDGRLGKVVMAVKPSLDRDRQGMYAAWGR